MAKAPAAKQSTAVTNWEAALAQAAQKQKAGLASLGGGSNWLSFRGAQLTVDGAAMPGSKADVVIFSYMEERAFYEGDFDPDSPASPVCYAYGPVDGGAALAPHEKASQPQAKTCKECEHAEWGSADKGRGQACRQRVRLALIPLSSKATPQEIERQPMCFARVPTTSTKNVKGWLSQFAAEDRPTFSGITELAVLPDAKNQIQVKLAKLSAPIPVSLRPAVLARVAEAEREIAQPYPDFEDEAPAKKAGDKKKASGKRKF